MTDRVRLLYVDDDAGLGRLVSRALASQGIDVQHAETGGEGLRRLETETFDALALDHNLASETGLDVLAEVRRRGIDVPVIYVTGSEDARVAVAALKAGAADYVWKDIQGHYRELMGQAVHSALEQQRLKREAEAAQQAVREARDRAEVMLGEVNHRVANSLALVASLARLQANAEREETTRNALLEMQARIMAIAGVHRRLYNSSDVRVVDVTAYLQVLIQDLGSALNQSHQKRSIVLRAEPGIRMPTDKAVWLGVIVTELVTNAFKYAYAPKESGEVRVILQCAVPGRLRIAVEDDGAGWNGIGTPKGSGLGTRVISAMATSLKSALRYDPVPKGTRAFIEFEG
jgi:two-component sensor histidine kinase